MPSLAWSYFKACAIGFATSVAISLAIDRGGQSGVDFWMRLYFLYCGLAISPSIGAMFIQPVKFLARWMEQHNVPRGIADVSIGGICGSFWLVSCLFTGQRPNSLAVGFLLGGLVAGYSFWKSRGYPGGAPEWIRIFNMVYGRLRKV